MQFDPDVVALFAAMREANAPTIDSLPPREARLLYRLQSERLGGPAVAMADIRDLEAPGPGGAIPLRLYRPDGVAKTDAPLLVYYHGGGWVIGDLDTHDGVCRQLAARAKCLVLAVHYRLAPEHPAPAAGDDAVAALAWVFNHAASIGADPTRIAVGGDSAGGNLAAVAALVARNTDLPLRAQILIYPAVDLRGGDLYASHKENAAVPPLTTSVIDYFMGKYMPDAALANDWHQSPILAPDKTGVAPATVITAERDALRDEGLAYADALEKAGVPVTRVDVPGMIHGFIGMAGVLTAARAVLDQIATELTARLAK